MKRIILALASIMILLITSTTAFASYARVWAEPDDTAGGESTLTAIRKIGGSQADPDNYGGVLNEIGYIYSILNALDAAKINAVNTADLNWGEVSLRINDTANANQDAGITVKETETGKELLSLKSDITSPMTAVSEEDTFGYAAEIDSTYGGLEFVGIADSGSYSTALHLGGYAGTGGNTATNNLSIGCVRITGAKSDGTTGTTEIGDGYNLLTVFNDDTLAMVLKGNGELYTHGTKQTLNTYNFIAQSSHSPAHYQQTSWDMPSLAPGAIATLTVTGWTDVYLGDFAMASFEIDLGTVVLHAHVSATNEVTVIAQNLGATTVNFSARNVFTRVWRLTPQS